MCLRLVFPVFLHVECEVRHSAEWLIVVGVSRVGCSGRDSEVEPVAHGVTSAIDGVSLANVAEPRNGCYMAEPCNKVRSASLTDNQFAASGFLVVPAAFRTRRVSHRSVPPFPPGRLLSNTSVDPSAINQKLRISSGKASF